MRAPVVAAGLLFATLSFAAPKDTSAPRKDGLIAEVLDLSGTKRQLDQLPAVMHASMQPAPGQPAPDPETAAALKAAVDRAFVPAKMYQAAADLIRRRYAVDDLHGALQILRTPMALKFTAWEVEAGKPEAVAALQAYQEELRTKSPDPARLLLVNRLDNAVGGSELFLEIQLAAFRAAALAAAPTEDMRKEEEAFRSQLAQVAKSQTLSGYLFMYRQATTEDLEAYLRVLESPQGKSLVGLLLAGTKQALTHSMSEFGRDIARQAVEKSGRARPSPSPAR
jgi:hypothetical protein